MTSMNFEEWYKSKESKWVDGVYQPAWLWYDDEVAANDQRTEKFIEVKEALRLAFEAGEEYGYDRGTDLRD